MRPRYFRTPAELRRWLKVNHARARELVVGFHKKRSGEPSLTWPESVQQALCFGWIDGVRRRLDATRYCVRFTPRRPGSVWSAVNIRKVAALRRPGRMAPAGLKAFAARRPNRSGGYSYEQRPAQLPELYARMLRRVPPAWRHFRAQTPSYQRAATWWVISAKREPTRGARQPSSSGRRRGNSLRSSARAADPPPPPRARRQRLQAVPGPVLSNA